jgi:hypothetical protein
MIPLKLRHISSPLLGYMHKSNYVLLKISNPNYPSSFEVSAKDIAYISYMLYPEIESISEQKLY